MGREGRGRSGEETEEEERCHGGPGEGPQQSRAAQQMCDYPPLAGRTATGVPQEGSPPRHLLPRVALA